MARLKALQQFVIREIFKDAPTGVMRTLPNQELVDMNVQVLAQRLMQGGIDPTALKNANQVENAIKMIESRPPVQQGITSTKSAKVFNIAGEELDPSKPIMGGTQPGKKINTDAFIRNAQAQETEAQIAKRLGEENKRAAQRMRNKKLIQDAIDNVSPGFVKGDNKYNAEIVAEEIANQRGQDYYDMDTKQR